MNRRLAQVSLFPRFFVLPATASVMLMTAAAPGQVVDLAITLDGSQEVPAVTTVATGSGTATLDTATNLFSWNITFSGLEGVQIAAHFHSPASICAEAGVAITLPLGSPIVGMATVTPQQAADILAGLWYVNVHTSLHPGGEIRGQVVPAPLPDPIPDPILPGPVHVRLETVATGLTAPNWGTHAPGDTSRLFVTDQPGILWAIDLATGTKIVFLDVTSRIPPLGIFGPGSFDERGLLGVAFHPKYQVNGLLYTYTSEPVAGPADFTTMPPGAMPNHQSVIIEWRVPVPSDPASVVDPASARVLLTIDQPQFNHNAGAVNFGLDGMLYIALGDGGNADDQDTGLDPFGVPVRGHSCGGNGRDNTTILGSIVRIDPTGTNSANGQYGIPADNPFVGMAGVDEIFAYGFRNPFRFSFDSVSGTLYAADVGQNHIEEVDVVVSGGNYGWNHKEGSFFFIPNGATPGYVTDIPQDAPAGLLDPIIEYDHDEGIAIIGGFVYRGTRIAPLFGRYVFGEFAKLFDNDGRLFFSDASYVIEEFQYVDQPAFGRFLLGMGQDGDGELYALANSTGTPFGTTGVVLKITTITGDIDANGVVDVLDLLLLLGSWGPCPGCPMDLTGDGVVDVLDLLEMLANWS